MRPCTALVLLIAAAAGSAADEAPWILGISEIPIPAVSGTDTTAQAAVASLPPMILQRIRDVGVRWRTEEEVRKRSEAERLKKIYSAGAEAADIRDQRDSSALSPEPPRKRASDTWALESRLAEKQESLESVEAPAAEPSPAEASISVWKGHETGEFLTVSGDPAYVCEKENLDYLILWDVREIQGFIRLRMEGWNAALGRPDFQHTAYCSPDNVGAVAEELANAVIHAVVGRESSRIVLSVTPPGAKVFVDQREMAPGRNSLRIFEEREIRIRAEAPGHRPAETIVRAVPGTDVLASLSLEPAEEAAVLVSSEPSGASLYLDGLWAGTTPVSVPSYLLARTILLRMPGYEDLFAVIDPQEGREVTFTLDKEGESAASSLERRKEKFYNALGFLVVSLPVSIVSYGVYLQSEQLLLEDPGSESFLRRRNISAGGFAAAAAVSGAFLVNTAVRLVFYIKSAR